MSVTPANNFTALSVALSRNGQNLAPRDPIVRAFQEGKPPATPDKFHEAVKKKYSAYMSYMQKEWDEIVSMGQLVSMFINGNQILQRRPYGPGYYVRPLATDDTYRQTAMNLMRFYYQCCETKMMASNPNVTIRPGGDQPIDIATAQAARPVVDYWESQFYTAKFSRRESLYAATNGMFIHRVRWNPFKGEWMAQSRDVSEQSVQLDDGSGECYECQHQGTARDFQETQFGHQCMNCGSAAVDVQKPQPLNLPQVSIGASTPVGEPEIVQTPLPGWRWDLSKELEESSWAIYRQRITPGALKLMLGNAIIPDTTSSDDRSLDVLHSNAYAGQPFGGAGIGDTNRRDNDTRPTIAEFWMSQEDLAEIEIEESMTVSGVRLPKGRMSDSFKGPVCFVGVNDMSLILGVYANETHKDEVVTGQWFIESDSGAGRGMQDTAAVQKRFNAVDGQIYQGLAGSATPAWMTDTRLLKEDQSKNLNRPNATVDVNLSMLPPGLGLKDAVFQLAPGNVNQQYIQYGSVFLRDMFQVSSMVTEFSDFMSIDNRTATGAQITAGLANSLFAPMLLTKGESRVRIAKILVRLEATYGKVSRYFPGKGLAKGRNVSGSDLKGKIIYELTQNSEMPVTPYSQQNEIRALFEATQGVEMFLMLKEKDPALFKQIVAPFNVKIEAEDSDVISTICLTRLEQMESNLEAGVDDPQMLIQSLRPPVSKVEPKQKEKAEWWRNWLDLDTGMSAPMPIRMAGEGMYWVHQNYQTQIDLPQSVNAGLVQGAGMAAAQAPSALGQQMLQGGGDPNQGAQQQHEADQAAQDRQQADVHKAADQDHEAKLKAMELQGQLAVTHEQGQNAIETAKVAGDNAVRAAKAKPKPVKAAA
jgi:hypothetical protein